MSTELIELRKAARLEGMSYSAFLKYRRSKKIVLLPDPEDGRKKLIRRQDLSSHAQEKLSAEEAARSLCAETNAPGLSAPCHRSDFESRLKPPFERILVFPPEPSLVAPPGRHQEYLMDRLRIAAHLYYESWKGEGFENEGEYIRALARKAAEDAGATRKYSGSSERTIQGIKSVTRRVMADSSISDKWAEIARILTPQHRPGRGNSSFYVENGELGDQLINLHRRLRSPKRAHEALCSQIPHGTPVPTFDQSYRFIKKQGAKAALRGREAVKVAAGYIDRHYDDEFASDAWCLDEWQLDGVFYDEQDHSRIFNYGEKGPVAHILSVMDERTIYIMDWILTSNISLEEATLELAERLVRRYWLPTRLVTDRAGRFRALSRQKRVIVRSRGELVDSLMGPLGQLGVKPRGSEEENPRGNRIERAAHREYARRAVDFGISWKGANTEERKLTDIDERVKRHLSGHCKRGICGPQLLSIQEAEHIVARWVNELNTGKTRAKGCHGMTRLAAFSHFRPTEFEISRRKPGEALLDLAFAERDQRTIQPGGVIELKDGKRYSDFELVGWVGEKVEVLRYRRDPSMLQVFAPGQEGPVIAHLRRAVGTNEPDVLSEEIAKLQHARKILACEETPLPAQGPEEGAKPLSINPREFFSRPEAAGEADGLKPLSYFGDDA